MPTAPTAPNKSSVAIYSPKLFTEMPAAANVLAFAYERVASVDDYVAGMQNAVLGLVAPTINPVFPTGGSAPAVAIPNAPEFEKPTWIAPAMPAVFAEALDLGGLEVQPFDEDAPTLSFGSVPAAPNLTVPEAPPVNFTYEDPQLTVNLPAPPNLLSINVSPFGGINMPTFDAAEPVLNLVAPSIREYTPGKQYTSSLLTKLQSTLLDRISGGGTGLGQAAETGVWERGKEREARGQADAIAQLDEMEGLGFMLPPGAYVDARIKIITETDAAGRGHSREVMVESARLELDNVKHALTTATQLEGQLIDYTNSTEQRIFDATRYATEAGVSIYNAGVQAYAAMVDVYRVKVNVYEARVRAEMAKVDVYRAQIDAEQAKAQVNTALVSQYQAQVTAALSAVDIYRARIAGIQAKADIEKTKVEAFGEQVRAYTAQINGYTAGVEGFRATVQAEQAKQQAYSARVDAYRTEVEASTAQINSRIAAYRARIDVKAAEYDAYKSAIAGESARVDALSKTNGVIADAYRAETGALASYNDVLTKQWQATTEQAQRTAEIGVNTAKANAELYITTRSLALDASKTGATVAAQIGAAAVNALNYSASMSSSDSMSYSIGYSETNSYSYSQSDSTSLSTSTSTNYNRDD